MHGPMNVKFLLLLPLALQSLVNLILYHTYPLLFSILLHTSPLPNDQVISDLPQQTQAASI